MTGWPANPKLVRHLKSTLIRTGVHVDEAVMGLSVHTDEDGGGDNPLLQVDEAVMGPQYRYTRTETERATTPYYRYTAVCALRGKTKSP